MIYIILAVFLGFSLIKIIAFKKYFEQFAPSKRRKGQRSHKDYFHGYMEEDDKDDRSLF
ncbi:hypothetical protein [Streptococcus halichoeri]|uniref:hypothetical protein n=1 Tax=Streptococcus halichoeri TaxID=254785 RepID=UPI001356742C|nr:hypothetical protein [Streptococcus halichoeri]